MERLRFRKSGAAWTATHMGHEYRVTTHRSDGYRITRDGKRRYPYPLDTLRKAQEVADGISEFDVGKTTFRRVGHHKGPLELERDDGYSIRYLRNRYEIRHRGKQIGTDPTLFGAKKKVTAHAKGGATGTERGTLRSAIRRDR